MNWSAISAISDFLAAVGVILSLIYLAIQIRQSNRNYRIESARSVMGNFHGNSWDVAKNAELRRIMLAAVNGYATMDQQDSSSFDMFMWRYLGNAHDALQLYEKGLLDEESFEVIMQSLLVTIRSIPEWWTQTENTHIVPPSPRTYLQSRLDSPDQQSKLWTDLQQNWKDGGESDPDGRS